MPLCLLDSWPPARLPHPIPEGPSSRAHATVAWLCPQHSPRTARIARHAHSSRCPQQVLFASNSGALAHAAAASLPVGRQAVPGPRAIRRPELGANSGTAAGRHLGARGPSVGHPLHSADCKATAVPRGDSPHHPARQPMRCPARQSPRCPALQPPRRPACWLDRFLDRLPRCRPARMAFRRPVHRKSRRPRNCPTLSTLQRHGERTGD